MVCQPYKKEMNFGESYVSLCFTFSHNFVIDL